MPPDSHVDQEFEAEGSEGELAFVDDESGVGFSVADIGGDLIEGDDDGGEGFGGFSEAELEGEEGGGELAGDGDGASGVFQGVEGSAGTCDEHGAVAVAHRAADAGEGVTIGDVGIGVDGDGGDFEFGVAGALVECLDVLEDVLKAIWPGGDEVLRQGVKHEGVVGVWGMAELKKHGVHRRVYDRRERVARRVLGIENFERCQEGERTARNAEDAKMRINHG